MAMSAGGPLPSPRTVFFCLLLAGAGLRAIDLWHPVDGTIRESWREPDVAAVARNYYREGMNLLYPRIDWRGDGPGYAEMEFPVYPWLIALLYKLLGFHEVLGRLLSYALSLATLVVFARLAQFLLPPWGAAGATLFFVLNPLLVRISNSLQPDGVMFFGYVLGTYAFIRWLDEGSWTAYFTALMATALAILAKGSAAHIGVFYLLLLIDKSPRTLKQPVVWALALGSLLPGVLWYLHARGFWLRYGNSLGLSNEPHWIGWDISLVPHFVFRNLRSEVRLAATLPGLALMAWVVSARLTARPVRYAVMWLGSVWVFYVAAARTTGDTWAAYYHVVSVPPMALLFGSGFAAIMSLGRPRFLLRAASATVGLAAVIALASALAHSDTTAHRLRVLSGVVVCAALLPVVLYSDRLRSGTAVRGPGPGDSSVLPFALAAAAAATWALEVHQIIQDAHPKEMQPAYECAQRFAPQIESGALILANGGPCVDESGLPAAYNASYMFYWLDRKGWNVCIQEQSLEVITGFANRGARYYVVERAALDAKPGFEATLRGAFPILSECDAALLFELPSREPRAHAIAAGVLDRELRPMRLLPPPSKPTPAGL